MENGIVFHHGTTNSRGVIILFSKHFDSQKLKNIYKDINGYFIILTSDIDSGPFILCNLYAPNVDYLDFFKTLTMHIDTLELDNIIMGEGEQSFVDSAENKCLVVVFRFMIPESRKYTWPRGTPNLRPID